eukprot:4718439-Amphidinium_carterae.1
MCKWCKPLLQQRQCKLQRLVADKPDTEFTDNHGRKWTRALQQSYSNWSKPKRREDAEMGQIAKIPLACYQGHVVTWASSLQAHIKLNQEDLSRLLDQQVLLCLQDNRDLGDNSMAESGVRTSDPKDKQGVQCVIDTTAPDAAEDCPADADAAAKAGLASGTKMTAKLAKVGQSLGKALTAALMSGQATHSKQLGKWQQEYQVPMSKKQDKFEDAEDAEAILAEGRLHPGFFPSIAAAPEKAASKRKREEGKGKPEPKAASSVSKADASESKQESKKVAASDSQACSCSLMNECRA